VKSVIPNVLFLAFLVSYIQAILNNMSECPVRALSQSPGLAALFAANPGEKATKVSTLKGLHLNPTPSGLIGMNPTPGVDRKKCGLPWALRINRFAVVSQNADWGCFQRGWLMNCGRRPHWEIYGVFWGG
jgi:hypothetical protein